MTITKQAEHADVKREPSTAPGSADALRALWRTGTMTDVPHAAPFVGVAPNKAYELIKAGAWPTRVFRLGKKIRIPVADLAELLGVELG